ncbi:MAG: sugar-binding protein [Bacillota bacterium]
MKKFTKRIVVITLAALMVLSMMPGLFGRSAQTVVEFKTPVRPALSEVSVVQSTKASVKLLTYTDIKKLVWDAIDKAGGFSGLIKDNTTVSLKVNLVNSSGYNPNASLPVTQNGVTTDWRVAKAVAEKVRVYNPAGKVYIIEGSYMTTSTMFSKLGYNKTNIPQVNGFISLDDPNIVGDFQDTESPNLVKVHFPAHKSNNNLFEGEANQDYFFFEKDHYYNADTLISIPVLKNHWDALVTGGIKNLSIGGTPKNIYYDRGKMATHTVQGNQPSLDLRKWIHDYYACRPADFVVIDGLQGSQYGPTPMSGTDPNNNGTTSDKWADYTMNMRTIIAGRDGVATDTIEGLITNAKVEDTYYLKWLQDTGVGNTDITRIRVNGMQVDQVRKSFKIAPGYLPGRLIKTSDLPAVKVVIKSVTESNNTLKVALSASSGIKKIELMIDNNPYGMPFTKNFSVLSLPVPKLATGKHTLAVSAYGTYLTRFKATKIFTKKTAIRKLTYGQYEAKFVANVPIIDGNASDKAWSSVPYSLMSTNWLGADKAISGPTDFAGKFKFLWSGTKLYFLAEITDDVLMQSTNTDPAWRYPDFDVLEVFVDENKSGGDHTFNNNAFAYHLTLSGHAMDLGTVVNNWTGLVYDNNVNYKWKSIGSGKYIWEGAITMYPSTFNLSSKTNTPVTLYSGKAMGVSVAYCDNDGDADINNPTRDHFMASNNIPSSLGGNYSNTAWQNANAFGTLWLLP